MTRPEPFAAVQRLWTERYPSAQLLFCGGSVAHGGGFPLSDLDVVVMFDHVGNAWRESLHFEGWPVEVSAHDAETLAYFVAEDCRSGRPALAHLISDALVIPGATDSSRAIQAWARKIMSARRETPSAAALADDRYWITDLLDDLRDDRPPAELRAIACKLYPLVCNLVLKTRGHWIGSGKTLPRLVEAADPEISQLIENAFDAFFRTGDRTGVLRATKQILDPFGGELFEGFRSDAPASSRVASSEVPWLRALA